LVEDQGFFSGIWTFVKDVFSSFWGWVKSLASKAWEYITWPFKAAWKYISGLGTTFFNAGKNIISSIWNGIKSFVNRPIQAIKNMVHKIRNLLPFSPAKEGPLRDLHKIRLVETIAATITANPLVSAMSQALGKFGNYNRNIPQPIGSSAHGGGSIVIHYSPTINGEANPSMLRNQAKQIADMVNEQMRKKERTKF
jgi:hypothetical protein